MKNLSLLSLICFSFLIMSCGKDPVVGCTDPASYSFNPLATEDSGDCKYPGCTDMDADNFGATFNEEDGSCSYFNRYLGSYSGTFQCMGLFASLLDEASALITKKVGDDNKDKITVIVSNPATEITFLLDATITKDEVVIDTYIPDFEYSIDVNGTMVEGPFELFITGTLARTNATTLAGNVNIRIDKIPFSFSDNCAYIAIKN